MEPGDGGTDPGGKDGGFIVRSVEMKGFMRYVQRTDPPITFPRRFTVITGPTGSGKTSILDAITFAFYKRSSRTDPPANVGIGDLCRPGGYVKVGFLQGGSAYDITRGFTNKGEPYLEVLRDGKALRGKIPEMERIIQDVVGLDYAGFCNSTFVRQEEMKALGSENPSRRLDIFQSLFRLEVFERAQALAKERLDQATLEIQALQGKVDLLEDHAKRLPRLREDRAALAARVEGTRRTLEDWSTALAAAEASVAELEPLHGQFLQLGERVRLLQGRVKEVAQRFREKDAEAKASQGLRAQLQILEAEVGDYTALEAEAQALLDKEKQWEVWRQKKAGLDRAQRTAQDEHDRKVRELQRRLKDYDARLKGLSTQLAPREAFDLLRHQGSLVERITRIALEIEWLSDRAELVQRLQEEGQRAQGDLRALEEQVTTVNQDCFVLGEIKQQVEVLARDLAAEDKLLEDKLRDLGKELVEVNQGFTAVGFSEGDQRRREDLKGLLPRVRTTRDRVEKLRSELEKAGDLGKVLEELETDRRTLEGEAAAAVAQLQDLARKEEAYQAARTKVEQVRRQREGALAEVKSMEGQLQSLELTIDQAEEEARELEAHQARLADFRARAEVLTILKDNIFHRRGVTMYAINRLLPTLEIEASRNLAELSDGRLNRVRLATYEENHRHGIRILVRGVDGQEHDVAEFSGGERTQINAALRFAIAKELAAMPQVGRTHGRMKTLFIDEGDLGSLDTEKSRDLFVAKLFKLGEVFEKVILITHLNEVADRFPARIRVAMTAQDESRVEVGPR